MKHRIQLRNIEEAAGIIDPVFLDSAQFRAEALGSSVGCELIVKVETLNPIRSFKGRGASFLASRLAAGMPVVCASAGNFGQGMAYACRSRGLPLTVFASRTASPLKLDRIRKLGATV